MRSDEEKTNALGRPERLFENLIFVIFLKIFDFVLKLQNRFYITFGVFRCVSEDLWMLEKPLTTNMKN